LSHALSPASPHGITVLGLGSRTVPHVDVIDLFSCVGGHALGLHAAGPFRTVQFVEKDAFRRRVLEHRFPGVPIYDDVRTFNAGAFRGGLVVGGPPCQRTSVAAAIHGFRTGESLWPDMLRVCRESSARWIVVEQPPGNREWEAQVMGDLGEHGWHASRLDLSAGGLGAAHRRRRVFVVAHADRERLARAVDQGSLREIVQERRASDGNPWREGVPGDLRVADGVPAGLDRRASAAWNAFRRSRIEAIGDSNPPIMMTVVGMAILAAERSCPEQR
jgi:DNA (cytosine-5)-methyltransferase 1